MTTIAFIGDRHISKASPRYKYALAVWDWVITDAIKRGATKWVGLGDVCEGTPGGDEAFQLCVRYHQMLTFAHCVEILGNHESVDALKFLSVFGVHVAWDIMPVYEQADYTMICIPYPRRGHAPFDNLGAFGDDGTIQGAMRACEAKITNAIQSVVKGATKPVIVAAHVTIEDMVAGASRFELHQRHEIIVPRTAFEGVALAVTGHIHRAQIVSDNIVGGGSLYRTDFGEEGYQKSYTLAHVDNGKVSVEFIPIPARDMVTIDLPWDELQARGLYAVMDQLDNGDLGLKEVRIKLGIPEDQLPLFDRSIFDPLQNEAGYFALDTWTIQSQRTRAPEASQDASMIEQLDTYIRANKITASPEALERLRAKILEMEKARPV